MKLEINLSEENEETKPEVNIEEILLYQKTLIAKLENRIEMLEGIFVQQLWALNETALVAGCLVQHLINEDDEEWKKKFNEAKKEMLETIVKGAADAEANNSSFVPTSSDDKPS